MSALKDLLSYSKYSSQVNGALTDEAGTAQEVVRGGLLNAVDKHSGHTGSK